MRRLTTPRWNRIKGTHQRGMHLEGRVWRELPGGYLIQAGRGRHLVFGFLSKAELRKEQLTTGEERRVYKEGDWVSAFVEDYDDERMRLVLSSQEPDGAASTRFLETVAIGKKLIGRVVNHGNAGVFVRLDNGFEALMPKGEIPGIDDHPVEDILHLGDQVAGVVFRKDITARHLHLSVTKYLSNWNPPGTPESVVEISLDRPAESAAEHVCHTIPKAKIARRVAVLDDDQDNLVGLGSFLLGCGHQVHTSDTLEKFFEDLEQYDIQCVVIDLFVHGENVLSRILTKIDSEYPEMSVITCSAFYGPDLTAELLGARGRIVDALLKPVDLVRLSERVESMKLTDHFEVEDFAHGDAAKAGEKLPRPKKQLVAKHRQLSLEDAFGAICRRWPKDTTLIVHRPRHSQDPEYVLSNDIDRVTFDRNRLQLKSSPIGNVINGAETVDMAELDGSPSGRGYYIHRIIKCSSMIGLPILVMDQPEYGLFVFRSRDEPFSSDDIEALQKIAWESHVALERVTNMETVTRDHTRLAMASLFAGVAHETGNAINAMVLGLQGVKSRLPELDNGSLSAAEQKKLAALLKAISERGPAISKILKSFLGGMSERPDAPVELYKLLHEVIEAVEPQTNMENMSIFSSVDPKLAEMKYPNLPIRQSVFNLVLNAIQHLQSAESREKRVTIRGGIEDGKPLPVWVSVTDTGYGVHEDLRERIFDAFFTTRAEGSGLGLYLARWFIESLGGHVLISNTVRFDGTEFRIELPYPKSI